MTRKCKYCDKRKPLEKFPIANTINGKVYRRFRCQTCYQQIKRKKINERKEWLRSFKAEQKCKHCGIDDFRVLVFHHRGDKDLELANAVRSWSMKRIKAEVAKCDVLCANCHMILHWEKDDRV